MVAARRLWTPKITTAALGIPLLLAGSLAAPAKAAPQQAPTAAPAPCPAAVPMASVQAGMTGQGLTVVRGKAPQPFTVEVLGVLPNGIAPGKNLILVEVSDVAGGHVVDQGGGIWAGMSGSPVYVGGKLLGSVSYGFTSSPSPIGGVTPAGDMMELLTKAGAAKAPPQGRKTIPLPASTRAGLATRAKVTAPRGNLQRLPSPLSVSGLAPQRLGQLQSRADAAGLSVVAYAGGSISATKATAAAAAPVAGGNIGAVMSYGDVTAGAVGTVTAVCGNQVLAFGHYFRFAGAATYGANDATSLAIVKDNTFGSFKMAKIEGGFGTVHQDRRSGLAARLGAAPPSTPVTTTIRNWDKGGSRTGTSRIVDQSSIAALVNLAVLGRFDATFDEVGDGRASNTWTIAGTRRGGAAFSLTRANRWASRSDLALEPANDIAVAVDALVNNDFEPVTIQRVGFQATFSSTFQQLRITGAAVSVNGGKYTSARTLRVKAGSDLKIRVSLVPYRSTSTRTTTIGMKVPAKAGGRVGSLMLSGGGTQAMDENELFCLLSPAGCETGPTESSLNGVLSSIRSAPRNDDVVANLVLESPEGDAAPMTTTASARQGAVVAGAHDFVLDVRP
ncbi:MAG TPA: SpoIVB peptidase S55 domain-containing protein [Propionibacteriaceae bacterium]|nr:SpoIVB peptidase S55 domain-containing protein [Propionibacteriaceae bacterium]